MKPFSDLNLPHGSYPGEGVNIVEDIYNPILKNTLIHKRSTYSFNSTSLIEIAEGIEGFVENGEKFYLLIGDTISKQEEQSIFTGTKFQQKGFEDICISRLKNLIKDKNSQKDLYKYKLGLLTNLIGSGKLEIRFCFNKNNLKNLQHTKLAIFQGSDDQIVCWDSSHNQSQGGLLDNLESVSLFKSWDQKSGYEHPGVRISDSFKKLWKGFGEWKTIEVPSKFYREFVKKFPPNKPRFKKGINEKNPKQPTGIQYKDLYKHQTDVLEDWIKKDMRGIVQHATGSGKTITGIFAIKEFFKHTNKGTCLILVPGDLLLDQWKTNIEVHGETEWQIDMVSSSNPDWKNNIAFITEPNAGPRVIIASMDSACTKFFLESIVDGSHIMILGDEAHNLGSPERSKSLSIQVGAAMGLSATINRPNDEIGNEKIKSFFVNELLPKYDIGHALTEDRLTKYQYHPTSVFLDEDEQLSYESFSLKISKLYASMRGEKDPAKRASLESKFKNLAIKRAKILKRARGKIPMALKIIHKNFKPNQRWLVYCESQEHLNALSSELLEKNIQTIHYHSKLSELTKENNKLKASAMKIFKESGGVMLSIGCLDEGVDIPSASHALILASSTNERQYIQRRGRVLRKDDHNVLKIAQIYDAIVVCPSMKQKDLNKISNIELKRALEFAEYSENNIVAKIKLEEIATQANIELESINQNIEFEEEDGSA